MDFAVMTYEAGRKKQVLVLQPKGKPLYNDSSSFGLKMLESMGWKKGNGLGRNQQGNLDFIQVKYRNNSNGLGFDGFKDNQWTKNESSFDDLLKNLNSQSISNNGDDETGKKKPSKSLEEMSKKSRARVHYKKFTKGKDVYKYSEKDLANILGKKSLKEEKIDNDPNEIQQSEVDERTDSYKSDLIVNTGISIIDYFKQKKIEKSFDKETAENVQENEESEEPIVRKRKKKDKNQPKEEEINQSTEETREVSDSKKKKKNKRKKSLCENEEILDQISTKKKKTSEKPKVEELTEKLLNKRKRQKDSEERKSIAEVSNNSESSNVHETNTQNSNIRPRGANAIYSNEVITVSTHVAHKMTCVLINKFQNSNLGNIIGYGMTDDIELKVIETKMGENFNNNDKYALYNMDRISKPRINQRKILTKIKKTKKSIQVI